MPGRRSGDGAGAGPDLEPDPEAGGLGGAGGVLDHGVELPPGVAAQVFLGDGHGGQARGGEPGEFDVVEAAHGDVGGHGDAGLVERGEEPEGHEVVEGDGGGDAAGEDGGGGGVPGGDVGAGGDLDDLEVGVGGAAVGEAAAAGDVGHGGGRSGEVGDAPVAVLHEVLDDLHGGVGVVDDEAGCAARDLAVDDDDGGDVGQEGVERGVGHARGDEHEGVAAGAGLAGEGGLGAGVLGGVGDEDAVAVLAGGRRDAAQDLLEHRVAQVGDDERDRRGAAEREAAGDVAGPVVELDRGFLDAGGDRRVHGAAAVHHPGHRRAGDAGRLGDVGDRHGRTACGGAGHLCLRPRSRVDHAWITS
ncbi:hypothetical protein ATJ88_0680 [Isoptericola jiangsuensis]|uniref:Uncharacterized protein n=1 Tax=Isoptericola jiangsuensis TaxID=548579 RepID=A0A2A9EUR8_9MICO|nr:hypothetical protein ATJ88_0680 [Isoptericola jiangsuensis]